MRMMPKLLLLLFCMSMVTMVFIARCGLNIETQVGIDHNNGGMPTSDNNRSPGEKALREVLRRKEVEHFRDKSALQEKIKALETQLRLVHKDVGNMTSNRELLEKEGGDVTAPQDNHWNVANNPGEFLPAEMMMVKNSDVSQQQQQDDNGIDNRIQPARYRNGGRVVVGNKIKARRVKPVGMAGDSLQLQRRDIRGQSDDYPLLDARMSQDFFPENDGGDNINKDIVGSNTRFSTPKSPDGMGGNNKDKQEIDNIRSSFNDMEMINADESKFPKSVLEKDSLKTQSTDHTAFIKDRLKSAEIQRGVPYKTEYELIPFNRFVFNRIFLVDPGLGKRVVGKPIGSKKKDLHEILAHAINTLNANHTQGQDLYSHDDFLEGIHRTDPATGTHYELIFRNKDGRSSRHKHSSHSYIKIDVVRPFAPPITIQRQSVNTNDEWINIILPLSGRLETFRIFINQFISVCIKQDKRVYLTVVYFGTSGLNEVKTMMSKVAKSNKFKHMKLITLNEKFTRGRALQIGALNWKHGDTLLFFCDVDVVFTAEFLERCRLNTVRGQRVYYPIVFSLYNPNIVYSLQDAAIPSFHDQLVLSKDTGFWRDFGYGMTCQYRSDFLKIKGFDEQITGWGGEDVFLYQKFVRSDYFVIRATDPAIFHLWHEKYCDPNLSAEQYRSCILSKALNEASHPQLGLLAFKDEINVHRSVSERNILKPDGGSSVRSKRRRTQDI